MFGLIVSCLKSFGVKGFLIYLKLKFKANVIQLPGHKHPLYLRSSLTDKITFKEIFLKREYDVSLPSNFDVKYIIDAGANIGFTSIFFANKFPNARIIAIEPDSDNYAMLEKNVRLYPNITPLQSALLNAKERITIVDAGLGKRGMMVEKSTGGDGMTSTSIDDLINDFKIPQIDILKMDIEGSEREVFSRNYEKWLPKTKCLIIELHDRMKPGCSTNVFKALSGFQYDFSIKGENVVFIRQDLL